MGKSSAFGLWKGMGNILAILTHRSPLSRVLGGVAIAFVLWLAAWAISYQVLSEGVLREVMSARVPDDVLKAGPSLAFSIFGWNLLFGVGATDPASFAAGVAILILVAAVAAYLPAHRASRIEPMVALGR